MSERVFSVLEKTLNYDFEFNDNKLNEKDKLLETELYNITIFGNNHVIAMGNMRSHPDNENLKYCVAYLIFKKKVICKVGIYEKRIDEEIGEEITKEDMDFTNLELIVDNYYYEEPYKLDTYVQTEDIIENVEDKKEEEKTAAAEDTNNEEEKTAAADDDNDDDETFYSLINKLHKSSYSEDSNYMKIKNVIGKYRRIIINYTKTINSKKKIKKKHDNDLDEIYKNLLPQIKKDDKLLRVGIDKTLLENTLDPDKEPDINESFLIFLQHYLNVKFIILPDKDSPPVNLSVYGDMKFIDGMDVKTDEEKERIKFDFNPDTFIYITKDGNTYSLVKHKNLDELEIKEVNELKSIILNKKNHEYSFEKQFETIKNVFTNEYKNT